MYALIALGYTMVYGVLEFINFAHSEIFIVGRLRRGRDPARPPGRGACSRSLPWPFVLLLSLLVAGMAASALLAVTVERVAYRPLRGAPRLIPLISAIGVSFFLQDPIRLVECLWRNAFNLVYPTMTRSNHRFELTETHRRVGEVARRDRRRAPDARGRSTCSSTGRRSARRSGPWPRIRPPPASWASTSTGSSR